MTNREATNQFKTAKPPADKLADRKARFAAFVTEAARKNAWVTSVSGAELVTFDALPASTLPADLRERGFEVTDEGWGERILATGITEHVPLTEGSTAVRTVTHAGIVKVQRWTFEMP